MARSEKSIALAGGAVAIELTMALHEKGVLTLEEARNVLLRASSALTGLTSSDVVDARSILTLALRDRLSER